MNNYDRIKSMSVEEMAKFLSCEFNLCNDCEKESCNKDYCIKEHEQWLLQEVREK